MAGSASDDLEELGREISAFILEAVRADAGGVVRAELVKALGEALEPKVKALVDAAASSTASVEAEMAKLRAEVEQMRASREQLAQDVKTTNRELGVLGREVRQLTQLLRRLGVRKPAPEAGGAAAEPSNDGAGDQDRDRDLGGWGPPEQRPWFERNARYLIAGAVALALAGVIFGLSTFLRGDEPGGADSAPPDTTTAADAAAPPPVEAGWTGLVADLRSAASAQTPGAQESLTLLCGPLARDAQCPPFAARLAAQAGNARWRETVARLAAERIADRNNCQAAPDAPDGAPPEADRRLACLLSEAAR